MRIKVYHKTDKNSTNKTKSLKKLCKHDIIIKDIIKNKGDSVEDESTIKVKYDQNQNPEKNFGFVKKRLKDLAEQNNISLLESIDLVLKRLEENGDETEVEEINLGGIIPSIKVELISYIKKIRKNTVRYESESNKRKKQEEKKKLKEAEQEKFEANWELLEQQIDDLILASKDKSEEEILLQLIADLENREFKKDFSESERKYISNKLNEKLNDARDRSERKENDINNAKKFLDEIQRIAEREYESGNVKSKAKYLRAIRDSITGEDGSNEFGIELESDTKDYFLQEIDTIIDAETDNEYYEQVRAFTEDFKFLRETPEVVDAIKGHSNKRTKFTDSKQYNRFYTLRGFVQKGYDEYEQISKLLMSNKVSNIDKKILEARKSVMDREKEKNMDAR